MASSDQSTITSENASDHIDGKEEKTKATDRNNEEKAINGAAETRTTNDTSKATDRLNGEASSSSSSSSVITPTKQQPAIAAIAKAGWKNAPPVTTISEDQLANFIRCKREKLEGFVFVCWAGRE